MLDTLSKKNKINICQVVPSISLHADGVAAFVKNLCDSISADEFKLDIVTLDWSPIDSPPDNLKTFSLGNGPRKLGRSPSMLKWLSSKIKHKEFSIIHSHGNWMMPNIYPSRVCKDSTCKLIVSPHGSLSQWAIRHNKFIKKIFWVICQKRALDRADCFHATSDSEIKDIRRLGFKQPISLIKIGVKVEPLKEKKIMGRRQLLFLSRVHPVKGVDNLLNAWKFLEEKFPEWDLHIVGPGSNDYIEAMKLMAIELKLNRVYFSGLLVGDEKLQAYRNASLYVLPTHSENFGITVAEALAAGTPVVVTRGAPWSELPLQGAGWWIEIGIDSLVDCLDEALSLSSEELNKMGELGHDWMRRDFSWESIGEKFKDTYRWLSSGGLPPPWVNLD